MSVAIRDTVPKGIDPTPGQLDPPPLQLVAAPDLIPAPLINQLNPGGRMVIPAGLADSQQLSLVEKRAAGGKISTKEIIPVRFLSG